MSEPSPLTTLALDVLMARGVQPHVVSDMWMTREVPALLRWPEERVKASTFLMREQPELGPSDAVALFEIVETNEELTLARWLTGRTWAKGTRMIEVMEAAHLTYKGSPRHTSELRHMLRKDKRVWLTRDDLTQIDKDYARDALAWFTALDRLRRYRT